MLKYLLRDMKELGTICSDEAHQKADNILINTIYSIATKCSEEELQTVADIIKTYKAMEKWYS